MYVMDRIWSKIHGIENRIFDLTTLLFFRYFSHPIRSKLESHLHLHLLMPIMFYNSSSSIFTFFYYPFYFDPVLSIHLIGQSLTGDSEPHTRPIACCVLHLGGYPQSKRSPYSHMPNEKKKKKKKKRRNKGYGEIGRDGSCNA